MRTIVLGTYGPVPDNVSKEQRPLRTIGKEMVKNHDTDGAGARPDAPGEVPAHAQSHLPLNPKGSGGCRASEQGQRSMLE